MRVLASVVTVAVLAACGGNDAEVDKLEHQVAELTRELATLRAELAARNAKAAPVPAEAPVPVETADAPSPECLRYLVTVRAYLACDKVPSELRDVATKSAAASRSGWSPSMTDDARKAASAACRAASDALREQARTLGCGLDLAEHPP